MKKIMIIGNVGNKKYATDGGRIKVQLFNQVLLKNNFITYLVNLEKWKLHIFSVILNIYRGLKKSDIVLIMAGPKGCRKIIPLVNFMNKKNKKKIIFCPVGIGTLDHVLKTNKSNNLIDLEMVIEKGDCADQKMKNELAKLDKIIVENEYLARIYERFYDLKNVFVLTNFRDIHIQPRKYEIKSNSLKLVYASRICKDKGILDLIEVVNKLVQSTGFNIILDIYGEMQLNDSEIQYFNSQISNCVSYKGVVEPSKIVEILQEYDLFVLPTKYYGEGTPGILVEALIAGVVPLVSNYSQASSLINHGENGLLYEFDNKNELYAKIKFVYENKEDLIPQMVKNAQTSAKKFTFAGNKNLFLNLLIND